MANAEDGKVNMSRDELAKGIYKRMDADVDKMLKENAKVITGGVVPISSEAIHWTPEQIDEMQKKQNEELRAKDAEEIAEMQKHHDEQIAEGKFNTPRTKEYMGVQHPIVRGKPDLSGERYPPILVDDPEELKPGTATAYDGDIHPSVQPIRYSTLAIHRRLDGLYSGWSPEYRILMSYAKMLNFNIIECKFIMDDTRTGDYVRNSILSGTQVFEAKYMELMVVGQR